MQIAYYTLDSYQYGVLKASCNVPWWARPLRWFLRRFKYEIGRWETATGYNTITFKPDDIVDLIRRHYGDIYTLTHRRPRTIILGREQQMELFESVVEYPFIIEPRAVEGYPYACMGMTIILDPFIDGVVVVPDLRG